MGLSSDYVKERLATALKAAGAIPRLFTQLGIESERWLKADYPPSDDVLNWDVPILLFKEAARPFSCVAEIGAMEGRRIVAVKESMPNVRAYALDIGMAYTNHLEKFGVTFMRHTPENFAKLPEGALILCAGTLCCMTPDEIAELFQAIAHKRMSLFMFEPAPMVSISVSISRRGAAGYYHPYRNMAASVGLSDSVPKRLAWRNLGNVKLLEPWEFCFFRP